MLNHVNLQIESQKKKISLDSLKRSKSTKAIATSSNQTSDGAMTNRNIGNQKRLGPMDTSRLNTTIFQDVTSKISGLYSRLFKKKTKSVSGNILPPELLTEANEKPELSKRNPISKK